MNSITLEPGDSAPERDGIDGTPPTHAGDGMPPFGWSVLRGLWFGILGGIACHWMAVLVMILVAALAGVLSSSPILAIGQQGLGELLFLGVIGSPVGAIIGMLIGGFSVMLMWMLLFLFADRSVRMRRIVGAACAFAVAAAMVRGLGVYLIAGSPLTNLDTYSNPWVWILLIDVVIVTLVGAWFAEKYLQR